MKFELGQCRLQEWLNWKGMTLEELARALQYKPERLTDYIENRRVMPLQVAISIADTLGCGAGIVRAAGIAGLSVYRQGRDRCRKGARLRFFLRRE